MSPTRRQRGEGSVSEDTLRHTTKEENMSTRGIQDGGGRVPVDRQSVDLWSRHLWHTSQHNSMVIGLGGRLQALANEMRETVGLEPFGWNDSILDAEFLECSVHVSDCEGQETHG